MTRRNFDRITDPCAAQVQGGVTYFEGTPLGEVGQELHREEGGTVRVIRGMGSSGHPFVSDDGRELFFEGNRRVVSGAIESDGLYVLHLVDGDFVMPEPVVFDEPPVAAQREMFPTLSPDGLTLFFVRVTGSTAEPMFATRESLATLTFSRPEQLRALSIGGFGSFSPSFRTWEVFLTSTSVDATAGNRTTAQNARGLFRARLCAGTCPERANDTLLTECPVARRSADGLHCYSFTDLPLPYASAATSCRPSGSMLTDLRRTTLASIHTANERSLVWLTARSTGSVWIGASMMSAAGPWTWASGEPFMDNGAAPTFWGTGEPRASAGLCATLSVTGTRDTAVGFGATSDCLATLPSVCETDLWPTW